MPFPDADALSAQIIDALGDAGIVLYPVRAALAQAYLDAGNTGTALQGLVERRDVVTDTGAVSVESVALVLHVTETVAASITVRQSSISYGGAFYDLIRTSPNTPGAVEYEMRKHLT